MVSVQQELVVIRRLGATYSYLVLGSLVVANSPRVYPPTSNTIITPACALYPSLCLKKHETLKVN